MKMVVIFSALIMSTQTVLACTAPEAQFTGVVSEARDCSFKIKFSSYNESSVCGIDIEEAVTTTFNDASCSLKNNDQVAGYLVVKDGHVVIE